MPVQEENSSFEIGIDQKPNFNTANLADIEQGNTVTGKNVTTNTLRPIISANVIHKLEQDADQGIYKIIESITKVTESMVRMTEDTIHKLEQDEDARISKLAESMARTTEDVLYKLEQEEDARIFKMVESMARFTEATIGTFEQTHDEPYVLALKQTRLIEQLKQPCFQ